MTVLFRAAAVALTGVVLGLLLRRSAPELGLALSAAVSLAAGLMALELTGSFGALWETVKVQTGLSPAVLRPVFKCAGMGIVTRLTADMCRDAGQSAAASAVELCGTVCAMAAALPLIQALMEMIESIG